MSTASFCGAQLHEVCLFLVRILSGLGALTLCAPLAARMNAERSGHYAVVFAAIKRSIFSRQKQWSDLNNRLSTKGAS
jgi:hypothetical protein